MTIRTHAPPIALLLAMTVAGCAGLPRESDGSRLARYQAVAGAPVSSIAYWSASAGGFDAIDDEHLLLTTRPRQAYLLRLSGPCLAYDRGSVSLAISSNMGRISSGFDRVDSLRQPGMSCRIMEIRPLDMKALRPAEAPAQPG